MKFKVTYTEPNGTRVTEFCRTAAAAKKRAQHTGGQWSRIALGE